MLMSPYIFRWIKRCSLILALCAGGLTAEEDASLSLGKRLYDAGNYSAAITEFKRFLLFNPSDPRSVDIYRNIGYAYRALKQWEQAAAALKTASEAADEDSIREEVKMDIAVTMIAQQNYTSAELQLSRMKAFSSHPHLVRKADFLLAVVYLKQYQWENARNAFKEYAIVDPAAYLLNVDSLLSPEHLPESRSVGTAVFISSIVPGGGQWYAGNEWDAVNALAINSLFGYLVIDAVIGQRWQDAVIAFAPIFYRYYEGNRINAEKQVLESNRKVNAAYADAVLQIVYSGQ
jgi:tetratricopeptide (TPR) repeat protein